MRERLLRETCILKTAEADLAMPRWANLVGGKMQGGPTDGELAGGGIYACFWSGGLIYIGSFVGPDGDPFGGHVADRIYKHVMGFTLRAKALGFNPRPLRSIIGNLDHQIARDLEAARRLGDRVEHGSIKATYNKARFAAAHWDEIRDAHSDELFERFSFSYRRIVAPSDTREKRTVKETWLKPIEQALIRRFEPICNTEYRTDVDGAKAGFDEVADAFEFIFGQQRPSSPPDLPSPAEEGDAGENRDGASESVELDQIVPADDRWEEYYTEKGQLRVRSTSGVEGVPRGRTLLVRRSLGRVASAASPERLRAIGIEADPVLNDPMKSVTSVDFRGDRMALSSRLRHIVEAALEEVA